MTDHAQNFIKHIKTYQSNPALIQSAALEMVRLAQGGGIDISDPTNPFVRLMETGAVMAASVTDKLIALDREHYPRLAQSPEDLYGHMSDKDYMGRFAYPSQASFILAFEYGELIESMVDDPATGLRKVIIPRDTSITISDTTFTFQYPIEIRQLQHGGLQIVWDNEVTSPVQDLTTNVVQHEVRNISGTDMLVLQVTLMQMKVRTATEQATAAASVIKRLAITDKYLFARVYVQNADSSWNELYTTHSDMVYDPTVPTAILKVIGETLRVEIPYIYTSRGLIRGKVRIDVYETKGAIIMNLGAYSPDHFSIRYAGIDAVRDFTKFSAPLTTLRNYTVLSNARTTGGRDALPFEALRSRIISNAVGAQRLPITPAQIQAALEDDGYELVKNVDNLTNRVYLATRELPSPSSTGLTFENKPLITPAAASIETMVTNVAELVNNRAVIDNGSSVTITPDAVFQSSRGILKLVPTEQVLALLDAPVDQRALKVTQGNYLFTPFYYVLDNSRNEFEMRAYYLDSPEVTAKLFVAENDTTLLQIGIADYAVRRTARGYVLDILTVSSDIVREDIGPDHIHVQLAFTPVGERTKAYLNGTLTTVDEKTGEMTYSFDLATNYNVTGDDAIELTQFTMFDTEPRVVAAELFTEFDVYFTTSAVMPDIWVTNDTDKELGRYLLPPRIAAISHEKLRVSLGKALKALWKQARTVASTISYEKWPIDVQDTYAEDVFEVNPETGSIFTVVEGVLIKRQLHARGDKKYDGEGRPIWKHRAGDVKRDAYGKPIIISPRSIQHQIDLLMIDGVYFFATDPVAEIYRQEMINTFLSWIVDDLEQLYGRLLDQTYVYFHPKATLGDIDVMVMDGRRTVISATQGLKLSLYVGADVFSNLKLREKLEVASIELISQRLKDETVATSQITDALIHNYGDDVIDVRLSGLGGSANFQALTVLNPSQRCSLRKRLVARGDDSLSVEEDVTFDWIPHVKR